MRMHVYMILAPETIHKGEHRVTDGIDQHVNLRQW